MGLNLTINDDEAFLDFSPKYPSDDETEVLAVLQKQNINCVFAQATSDDFDTLSVAEIFYWYKKLQNNNILFNYQKLPQQFKDLLLLSLKQANIPPEQNLSQPSFLETIGVKSYRIFNVFLTVFSFISDAFGACFRFCLKKAVYRSKDFWFIFEDCSYKAVGICALVSFLVGLILAFVGALQLKSFGASIYVASMVALGMTRIMAAIMVGIIMAGRTGSSYAATIGTMQVNEEIDALKTFGIKISDYLVAPRVIALITTIPFLTILADILGIFGGAVVGVCFLNISPTTYFDYSIKAIDTANVLIGLLHSVVYGFIIALCGCYEGIFSGRDADAVGKATTLAVVTSLVWMIVATGILTVILEMMGL